jgi:outer membrane protein TolC
VIRVLATIVLGSALYGYAVGSAHSELYALRNLVKMPLLLLGTGALCALADHVLARWLLPQVRPARVAYGVLQAYGDLAALLASLSPCVGLLALSMRRQDDGQLGEYGAFLAANALGIAACGAAAVRARLRRLCDDGAAPPRARALLAVSLALSLAVGGQVAFQLRPLFGLPASRGAPPPPFCLGDAPDARGARNFYEAMWQVATRPPLPAHWRRRRRCSPRQEERGPASRGCSLTARSRGIERTGVRRRAFLNRHGNRARRGYHAPVPRPPAEIGMESRHVRPRIGCAGALLAAMAAACSSAAYVADADREVAAILGTSQAAVLGTRAQEVVQPEPEKPPPPAPDPAAPGEPAPAGPPAPPAPVTLDLARALDLAVQHNRDYQSRREGLYQQGLGYSLTRFNFGPQFAAAIGHVWSNGENEFGSQRATGSLGVSQILPTGGRIAFDSSIGSTWEERTSNPGAYADPLYDSSIGVSLSQPLLRGFGYEASHEALTQAERSLVYAVRDFELFRQNFSITIARAFFDLVRQQQTLTNEENNLRQAVFDRQQAEALLQVDRSTEVEVYRARRAEITAEDRLLDARTTFERARDQFKVQLGLPTTDAIEIAPSEPPFAPVRHDPTSAIAAAKHNRLDLRTEREQLEDVERSLRLARQGLLPDLSLDLDLGYGGATDSSLGGALPDRWTASAGISMAIPLQQKAERNSYRSALIAREQAQRNYTQRLDQVDNEIKDQLRSLRRLELQIELQEGQIVQEQRAVTLTEIRYESGDLGNRDLLEAREALFNARNALIQLKVDHFIARLTLLRDLGLLFVDDRGMWQ